MGAQKVFSPVTLEAARLLGSRVALARRERRWTIAELAERVGASVVTIRKVERGDPTVALGTALETAVLVGVTLFHEDPVRRSLGGRSRAGQARNAAGLGAPRRRR